MTKVINLYGGPGTGKSTNAARVFALLKDAQANVELITEYVKQWAWEKRVPLREDQFYIFGKQARREYTLFGQVEYVVTDAPIALIGYYAEVHGTPEQAILFRHMVSTYYGMCRGSGVEHQHYFLRRVKPYNPKGRFQNEEQARDIDAALRAYLISMSIPLIEASGDEAGAREIFERLL